MKRIGNRIGIALLFILAFLPNKIYAGGALQDKVSFEMPASWKLQDLKTSDTLVAKLYHIRTDTIGSEAHHSNALLQYYTVPVSVSITQADNIVASHTKGATFIVSAQDGPNWKTYLLINYERNQQYIVLYRIGVADGVCVELMFCFPHIADKKSSPSSVLTLNEAYVADKKMAGIFCDPSALRGMVDVFNSACEKLKISNVNQFKADVRIVDRPADAQFYRYKGSTADDTK
jgi:hypothetical protein